MSAVDLFLCHVSNREEAGHLRHRRRRAEESGAWQSGYQIASSSKNTVHECFGVETEGTLAAPTIEVGSLAAFFRREGNAPFERLNNDGPSSKSTRITPVLTTRERP